MEIRQYLEKIKKSKEGKNEIFSSVAISNIYYSEYNFKISKEEIEKYLNEKGEFFEIIQGNFLWKDIFKKFIKDVVKNEIKDTVEMEYFIELKNEDLNRILNFIEDGKQSVAVEIGTEIKLETNNPEAITIEKKDTLEENFEILNEGIKFLEPFIEKKKFWISALNYIIGNEKKTVKEIYKEIPFFKKAQYGQIIEEILEDRNHFKKVDIKNSCSKKNNIFYIELSGNFNGIIDEVIEDISEKYKEVFPRKILGKETLQQIGDDLEVSRERIRQVEIKIREKFDGRKIRITLKPYLEYVTEFFQREENMIAEKELFSDYISFEKKYFGELKYDLVSVYNQLNDENKKISIIFEKYLTFLTKEEIENTFTKIFIKENFISEDEFLEKLESYGINNGKFIEKYIEESGNILKEKGFVLCKESKISILDKVEFIFRMCDRELKISEIAKLYEEYFGDILTEHNVATKLQSNDGRFRRIFTGTYSLTEWGMSEHVMVKDLIVDFLRKKGKPLSHSEILSGIKDKTFASENTIKIFAYNDKTFSYSQGIVALREWKNNPEKKEKYFISENRLLASQNSVVNENYKGTFEKNGKKINFHRVGAKYLIGTGQIDTGRSFFENEKQNKFTIKTTDKEYIISISANKKDFYGISKILKDKNLELGDYFYLENCGNGILNFYTWREFEDGSLIEGINYSAVEEPSITPIKEPKTEVMTFDEILSFGLKEGYVYSEWLQNLDYSKEIEVADQFEAIEELEEREVKIRY